MTIKEAKHVLSQIGVSLRKTDHGEYRVNFKGGKEATAYYTNDLDDAVGTGKMMVKPRAAYTLTLTQRERQAIDWVGGRYAHGNDLCLLLIGCLKGDDEWSQDGDMTFEIPEGVAWAIQEIANEDNHNWTCFSRDLASKLDEFCDNIV